LAVFGAGSLGAVKVTTAETVGTDIDASVADNSVTTGVSFNSGSTAASSVDRGRSQVLQPASVSTSVKRPGLALSVARADGLTTLVVLSFGLIVIVSVDIFSYEDALVTAVSTSAVSTAAISTFVSASAVTGGGVAATSVGFEGLPDGRVGVEGGDVILLTVIEPESLPQVVSISVEKHQLSVICYLQSVGSNSDTLGHGTGPLGFSIRVLHSDGTVLVDSAAPAATADVGHAVDTTVPVDFAAIGTSENKLSVTGQPSLMLAVGG